jgi:hypothetical protein
MIVGLVPTGRNAEDRVSTPHELYEVQVSPGCATRCASRGRRWYARSIDQAEPVAA